MTSESTDLNYSVSVEYARRDAVTLLAVARRGEPFRAYRRRATIIISSLFLVLVVSVYLPETVFLIALLVAPLIVLVLLVLSKRRLARETFTSHYSGEYQIDSGAFAFRGQTGWTMTIPWIAVTSVEHTRSMLAIRFGQSFLAVPDHAFADDEERRAFEARVRAEVAAARS